MKNINKKVRQFRKRFRISGIPSCEELKTILSKLGYYVTPYTDEERSRLGEQLYPAYTFEYNDNKVVYYDSLLCDNDIVIALAHELAHICLAHSRRANGPYDTSTYKDYEADIFVYKLFTYKQRHIKNIIFTISLVLCFSNLACSSFLMKQEQKNTTTQNQVVVTSSGKKYHHPHCYYVKYKTNTINLSKSEAIDAGKEPCEICAGE